MTIFNAPDNSAKPVIHDGQVTYSYFDSNGRPHTETRKLLEPNKIVQMVSARMQRFESAPLGSRESELSRAERKYIAAQPVEALREAWRLMDEDVRGEFSSMMDGNSFHGISDPKWLAKYEHPHPEITGDDAKPFNTTTKVMSVPTSLRKPY